MNAKTKTILMLSLAALTWLVVMAACVRAEELAPSPTEILSQVNKILDTHVETLPEIHISPDVPWAWEADYRANVIRVSARVSENCRGFWIAHEMGHYVAEVAKLTTDRQVSELLAKKAADGYEPWSPSCATNLKAPTFVALAEQGQFP